MDLTRELILRGPFTPLEHREANNRYADFRYEQGMSWGKPPIFTPPEANIKFEKSLAWIYGLALAQARSSLITNVCPFSTPECRKGCVSYAGRGVYSDVQEARILKTMFLKEDPEAFLGLFMWEIEATWRKHGVHGRIRPNTFSDIRWELVHPELFSVFPRQKFYDYTKWPLERRGARLELPQNYRLTSSASEQTSDQEIRELVDAGRNVAVVFAVRRTESLPKRHLGIRVIDGDKGDDRYADPQGVIVGLRSKGRMRTQGGKMPRKVAA